MPIRVKSSMPEFAGETTWLNKKWTKEDLLGDRPALIHFWSISCGLCEQAMSGLNQLRDDYQNSLHVVSVHMPRSKKDQNIEEIKQKAVKLGITQAVFVDNDHQLTDEYKNEYVPSYYLFDQAGTLFHVQSGDGGIRLLKKKIERLIH